MFKRGLITLLLTPVLALIALVIAWQVFVLVLALGALLGLGFLYLAWRNLGKKTEKAADAVGRAAGSLLGGMDQIVGAAFGDDKHRSTSATVRGETVDKPSGDDASGSAAQRHDRNEN